MNKMSVMKILAGEQGIELSGRNRTGRHSRTIMEKKGRKLWFIMLVGKPPIYHVHNSWNLSCTSVNSAAACL